MRCRVGGVQIEYVEHGSGLPLLALHGAGVDHRELEAGLEPLLDGLAVRRIYPDLPAMGRSTADGLGSNDDVVAVLDRFVDLLGLEGFLLAGHSYGGYLARGLSARRRDAVRGLALLAPVGERTGDKPAHAPVRVDDDTYDDLDPALREGFDGYFVVRTASNAARYRDHVAEGIGLVDGNALGRIFGNWPVTVGPFDGPVLIVAGRRDAVAGHADATALAEEYPHTTLAVLDDVGHALVHERPGSVGALLNDWVSPFLT